MKEEGRMDLTFTIFYSCHNEGFLVSESVPQVLLHAVSLNKGGFNIFQNNQRSDQFDYLGTYTHIIIHL